MNTTVIFLELAHIFGPSQAHLDLDSGQKHIYGRKTSTLTVLNKYTKMHQALVSQTYMVSVTVGAQFINSDVETLLHEKVFPLTYPHL